MPFTAEDIARLFQYGMIAWLAVLSGYVLFATVLNGRAFREMLTDARGVLVPERLATFAVILVVAGYYLLTGTEPVPDPDIPGKFWMPDIPDSLLIVLAGGKSLFLAGKLARPQMQ